MIAAGGALLAIVAFLAGVRWFALKIARITEGKRPQPLSDDAFYQIAHGDCFPVFHNSGDTM